ncbi:MAG: PE-PPE domain-containing protein [Mycobacterium sp.]
MQAVLRPYAIAGVALVGAGVIAVAPVTPAPIPDVQMRAVQLTGDTADSSLGDGTAFAMGGSGLPIPSQSYVDTADSLYLAPLGFTGNAQALFTPEGLYPVSGVKSLPTDTSFAQGQQILDSTIQSQINGGGVDAANPVVVFGWSQSSSISGLTMPQLHAQDVPSADVHFVLVGDPSAPNGGVLERFDIPINGESPTIPSLGVTFSGATPADLYPTDIYTIEYDGFADFPQYTGNLISDLNALFGLALAHGAYMGLTPEQLLPQADGGQAIQLPTSAAGTLTDYYMIPNQELPLLQLLPVIGQPLYDLLEPDTRILVNLGYGSITDGWSQGDAVVPTTFGLFPTNLNPTEVLTALGHGLQQGITGAVKQLENPDNYQPTPIVDNPALSTLLASAKAAGADLGAPTGGTTTSFTDIVNDFSGTLSNAYATLLPDADTLNAIFTTLPAYDANIFVEQLEAGNLLAAIGDPIAADTALIPFAITFGMLAPLGLALGVVST